MSDPDAAFDDQMMDELREVSARLDPVPARVLDAARQTFTWRTVDEELAQLAYDSLLDDRPLAGVRGTAGPRSLTFEGDETTIELEIITDDGHRTLIGQLVPAHGAEITAVQGEATDVVVADELGRFTLRGLRGGPLRLRVHPHGAQPFSTEWINI